MPTMSLKCDVTPEVTWQLTRALANLLRREAEGEPEFLRRRIEEIAAKFEAAIPGGADAG